MIAIESKIDQQRFRGLGPNFYAEVKPEPLKDPSLIEINPLGANLLGLKPESLSLKQWTELHNGQYFFKDQTPMSSYYAGHQFGEWAGRLGDGRAHILGEINGYELQIKGSGKTPFSRMGDGRAVLRSTLREYLASEYLHALGIPTSRSLGILASRERVQREVPEYGATMIRLAPSFIRFGTFEYFKSENKTQSIEELIGYLKQFYFPECSNAEDLFREVTRRTAELVAQWMAYGFCHGVMNTDNMSILGLTIDYGPYGFMEEYDPDYICNHSDTGGRYRYANQPGVAQWNLGVLAWSLEDFLKKESSHLIVRDEFREIYLSSYWDLMCRRCGLDSSVESCDWIKKLLKQCRSLIDVNRLLFDLTKNFEETLRDWPELLSEYISLKDKNSQTEMKHLNPCFVLRNWVAEEAIRKVEEGDINFLSQVREFVQNPFKECPELEYLRGKTPQWGKCLEISCSS